SLSFSVQDFPPQRLAVNADGRKDVQVKDGESRNIDVTARFLYGAVGAGLQTQGEARLRADPNPFPQFQDFTWGDTNASFAEKYVELGSTITDGEGHATLTLASSEAGETTVPLSALITTSVFEPGGRPVRESTTLKIRTQPVYIGVKVEEGQATGGAAPPVSIDDIAVDAAGARTNLAGVNYTLIAESGSYDWCQQDGKWQWRRTSRDNAIVKGALNLGAGGP